MDNDFCKNIIDLLYRSDIRFRTTDIRPVEDKGGTKTVSMELVDRLGGGPIQLTKPPVISCLVVFTLFDAYLENKYNMVPGTSFKQRYNNLPFSTNQNIIERECYRLMKTIRNGFVHNINAIVSTNDTFHFNYKSPQGTIFNLDLSSNKLELLYSIILILVKGKYEIPTEGHFENIISTYYSELKDYVDMNSNFTDDGDIGLGSVTSFKLKPISPYVRLNTVVRYPFINPSYHVSEDRINIKSIYDPVYASYSTDYYVKYDNKEYIIPQEILDVNNSLSVLDLSKWELCK